MEKTLTNFIRSLRNAEIRVSTAETLDALSAVELVGYKDRDFLKQGNVFTDDQIDAYIALKFEEIHNFEHTPHPIEFEMYYSC